MSFSLTSSDGELLPLVHCTFVSKVYDSISATSMSLEVLLIYLSNKQSISTTSINKIKCLFWDLFLIFFFLFCMYEKFTNASDKVYENVVLTQPIDPKASVYDMSVTIGDKMILAEVHEKEEAKKIFKKAADEGMGDKHDLLKTMFHVKK